MKKEDVIVTYSIHSSNDITTGLVAMDSSSSAPQLLRASTTVTKAATCLCDKNPHLHIRVTGTAGLSSTTEPTTTTSETNSTNTTTASNSTSPGAILFPRVPKRLPIPTSKSTPATTTVSREASNNAEAKTCSTRGVVKQCLIAIASLAALATIFMVSTIVLCTKLSARKYKVTKPQTATEMMCISSLLPERDYIYTRQRNPVSNGVLVMHHGGDSDEDAGDNLTLSSFLPDNDRYV
ncbi:P-selectin glycoprotein ligand 1 [Collichthys lucidus]|uniref:P-selectin glycoprotein ligand 1 n=1 Tax=Collichthys lucidus TaxID=240159 RepID=A0A4U5V938_COLLU|nr:P-selectin glycoprotein ligand 1 [Collichthys lucidus]